MAAIARSLMKGIVPKRAGEKAQGYRSPGSDPLYSGFSDLGEAMLVGAAKSVLTVGAIGGVAKAMGAPTSQVVDALMPVAMRKGLFGGIVGPTKNKDYMKEAGFVGKFAKIGQTLGGMLGKFTPFGVVSSSVIAPIAGLVADKFGDLFNLREGEELRDAIGDNEDLASMLAAAEGNPVLAAELQLQGVGSLLKTGEEQQEEAAEAQKKSGYFGNLASDMLNSVFSLVSTEDLKEETIPEPKKKFEDTPGSGAFGFSKSEIERGTVGGSARSGRGKNGSGGWAGGGMSTGSDAGSGGSSFA